jgi:hypothetical protein
VSDPSSALGELAAAVLETVARFLPDALESGSEGPGGALQPSPPKAAPPGPLHLGDQVRFSHRSFGTEMLGRIVGFRKPDRLVLRPTAMWWGSGWQKVTYTRTVVVPSSNVLPKN